LNPVRALLDAQAASITDGVDTTVLDPMVRWSVDPEQVRHVLEREGNFAWIRTTKEGKVWATVLDDHPVRAKQLASDLAQYSFSGITCHAQVWESLWATWPGRHHLSTGERDRGLWSLWACQVNAVSTPDASGHLAVVLRPDDERIQPLLANSTSAHVFPGDWRILNWVGVEDGAELVAVAGQIRAQGGASEVVSVCTHPNFRGRGYAGQCVAEVVRLSRETGFQTVILEAYTENLPAAAVYHRVGFTEVGRYCSWELASPAEFGSDLS